MKLTNNTIDLEITRGDTILFNFVVTGLGGSDLSEAVFSCKKNIGDTEYVFQYNKSVDGAIAIADYDSQTDETTYIVNIPAEATASLDLGNYYYDMQVTLNNTIITMLKGNFIISYDLCVPSQS